MDLQRKVCKLIVIGLILLVCSCSNKTASTSPSGGVDEDEITYYVEQGQVVSEIEFDGLVVPVAEYQLYFQTSGFVDQVYVSQGQEIKTGQVLVELGGQLLHNQIASAELQLDLAQAQLDQAESENAHLIALGELALNLAREELTRTLVVERWVAQAGVDRAELELEHLRRGVSPVFALEVQQAELALNRLRESSRIVAQTDGIVASVLVLPGQLVEAVEPVIVMANSDAIEIRAYPSQEQSREMYESQMVVIMLLNGEERTLQGKVRYLLTPDSSLYSVAGPAVIDNSTRISLVGETEGIKLGDAVLVKVILEQKDDVLWLPSDAIRTYQGRAFVIAVVEGGQRRVNVEIGITGQDRAEITKGLVKGQVVIAP